MGTDSPRLCFLSGDDRTEFPIRLLSPVMGLQCKINELLHVLRVGASLSVALFLISPASWDRGTSWGGLPFPRVYSKSICNLIESLTDATTQHLMTMAQHLKNRARSPPNSASSNLRVCF
jgi:hypothetical protein